MYAARAWRCVLALKQTDHIEKYRDVVRWGCLHNLSYDTQCEGTRASYVYALVSYFHDDAYFVSPTADAFLKTPPSDDHLFSHLCELLECFAERGNEYARAALDAKYAQLYGVLIGKRRFGVFDHERDAFENLCITLTSLGGLDAFLKIAEDMGALFRANPHYGGEDFDWFCAYSKGKFGAKKFDSLLSVHAEHSENIRRFHSDCQRALQALDDTVRKPIEPPEPLTADAIAAEVTQNAALSTASRIRFARRADEKEKRALVRIALSENDLSQKAELLSALGGKADGSLISDEVLIGYARSDHERLSEVALELLTHRRSEAVRAYAYELLERRERIAYAIEMLIANYTSRDKTVLLSELSRLRVDYDGESGWHEVGVAILDAFDAKIRLPKECLLHLYETTLCSCCRASAIGQLAKHRWLTRDLIEECRYDASDEIADYINRYYPKK